MPSNVYIENSVPAVREAGGILTKKNIKIVGGVGIFDVSNAASANFGSIVPTITGANIKLNVPINVTLSPVAVNVTATLTSAQILAGYITSTSAAAVTMTLPTGALLGGAIGATTGTEIEFYIDNTAGANTVTLAAATNGVLSAAGVAGSSAGAGLLTVPTGVTGVGQFTIIFSSATAYVFSRTA